MISQADGALLVLYKWNINGRTSLRRTTMQTVSCVWPILAKSEEVDCGDGESGPRPDRRRTSNWEFSSHEPPFVVGFQETAAHRLPNYGREETWAEPMPLPQEQCSEQHSPALEPRHVNTWPQTPAG
jgi:hypothetical protein